MNTRLHFKRVQDQTTPEFDEWFDGLRDPLTRKRLQVRLRKIQLGNFGDVKPVGAGVFELREFFGPGSRMYYVQQGAVLIVMLGGGDKSSQASDIEAAQNLSENLVFKEKGMSKKTKVNDLPDFDMVDYLKTDEDVAMYLSVVLEDDDPSLLAAALGDIARARGMTEIAKAAGLTREALYKALRPNSQPRFDTIARVCKALGLKLTTQVQAQV